VDVEVDRADVVRRQHERVLEQPLRLRDVWRGRHAVLPLGRRRVEHQRLGRERGDVRVVGKLPRDATHRLGVRVLIRRRHGHRVTLHQRSGECALARRLRQRRGAQREVVRGRPLLLALVDVRPARVRHPPPAHRAARIGVRGEQQLVLGLVEVEAVDERDPGVEVALRRR